MKKLTNLFIVVFLLITIVSGCTNKSKPKFTVPEGTKYTTIGIEIPDISLDEDTDTWNTYIYYFSEDGSVIDKQLVFKEMPFALCYSNNVYYFALEYNDIYELKLTTGELKKLDTNLDEHSYIECLDIRDNKLFVRYSIYNEDVQDTNNIFEGDMILNSINISVFDLNDITNEKSLASDSPADSFTDFYVTNEYVYRWDYREDERLLTKFDFNLSQLEQMTFGSNHYVLKTTSGIYIIGDDIYDVQKETKLGIALQDNWSIMDVWNDELIVEQEDYVENKNPVYIIEAYDIKSEKKLREMSLGDQYYLSCYSSNGSEIYLLKYDDDKVTMIPFDLATFQKQDTEFVIEFDNEGFSVSVDGLYTYK